MQNKLRQAAQRQLGAADKIQNLQSVMMQTRPVARFPPFDFRNEVHGIPGSFCFFKCHAWRFLHVPPTLSVVYRVSCRDVARLLLLLLPRPLLLRSSCGAEAVLGLCSRWNCNELKNGEVQKKKKVQRPSDNLQKENMQKKTKENKETVTHAAFYFFFYHRYGPAPRLCLASLRLTLNASQGSRWQAADINICNTVTY